LADFTVVIPARYASTRLPGKPLLDIAGKSMIQRVYEQASKSNAGRVIVATDDPRIAEVVESFGGEVCMTREDHPSGTDRLQEVAEKFAFADEDIIVNVQGDEPLIPPACINQVADNLAGNTAASIATLCEKITCAENFLDPNVVKVAMAESGLAHYFSRAPIPWPRDAFADNREVLPDDLQAWRHIGIYAYRVGLLNRFVTWAPAPTELTESLEQLRAMWQGEAIHVAEAVEDIPPGVDTEKDLQHLRDLLG
jgi:3-deoxy-manno-octulosonate cytidylyltransferase (CMP-KDO synthetase)